ncbi:MAG: tetratricopeptide repeat protein [Bacteroidaceae bacterium]|nr:tetratricopeptide repeat protein [Bacteroidaceae bacterium]
MGIFTSLFGGKKDPEREKEKNFDILKYDGIRAMRIGKLTYAIKCLEEATALREEPETMLHQANAYLRVNRMDDARRILTRITELTPEQPQAFLTLANLCYMQEDYRAMDEACRRALALDADNAASHLLAAKAALGLNNGIQAIAMLTRAIMLDEELAEAYQLRAEVLWQMRQAKDASEDIEKLLSLNPEDENALLLKAEIMAVSGDEEGAVKLMNEVLALNPFCEKAYLLKGSYLLAKQDADGAIAVYNEALEINPNFAAAYHERGRAKLAKGDKQGSMEDMKRAIELAPEQGAAISGEYNNYEQQKNIPF